jgi:alpha-glucosidase (family GH31 glycosyl hydrolase)
MNFPSDANTLMIDTQFMLGSAIMVSPVVEKGSTEVSAYFTQGLWYSFQDRFLYIDTSEAGVYKTINTPLTAVNVHIRGGSILPLQ